MLFNKFFTFVDEWLSQLILKSPKIISSFCLSRELIVDKMLSIESAGAEGDLYMFPIVKCLFSCRIMVIKRHSKLTGTTVGIVHLETRFEATYVATPPPLEPLSAL